LTGKLTALKSTSDYKEKKKMLKNQELPKTKKLFIPMTIGQICIFICLLIKARESSGEVKK